MWAEAAKHVAKFDEAVITALDASGFPVSVRQSKLSYDAATGTMPISLPDALGAVEGPANLVCHFHDEKLWGLRNISLKGRVERRAGAWVFQTTLFNPPSMWKAIKGMRTSMKSYLAQRNLPVPKVDFAVIDAMWRDAAEIPDP
jgi:hypothetical protein